MRACFLVLGLVFGVQALHIQSLHAEEVLPIWPGAAPGETTRSRGEMLPYKPEEMPPVVRMVNITEPTITVYPAQHPNGTAVVIFPGGGFVKVVTNKEGSEPAGWLNDLGISAFVVSYRTKIEGEAASWKRPLQDAQRAVSLIRTQAKKWNIHPDRIGVMGFSAGGQIAARLLNANGNPPEKHLDEIDDVSSRPDFALLIYPWNLYDKKSDSLAVGMTVPANCAPTFLVHTDDDHASSLASVLFYAGLKRQGIPAELHVYGNGGHGYGLRTVPGSQVSSWPGHAANWLQSRGLLRAPAANSQKR